MKLLRYGAPGAEKPGLLDQNGGLRDLSGLVADIDGNFLASAAFGEIQRMDWTKLPPVAGTANLK